MRNFRSGSIDLTGRVISFILYFYFHIFVECPTMALRIDIAAGFCTLRAWPFLAWAWLGRLAPPRPFCPAHPTEWLAAPEAPASRPRRGDRPADEDLQ